VASVPPERIRRLQATRCARSALLESIPRSLRAIPLATASLAWQESTRRALEPQQAVSASIAAREATVRQAPPAALSVVKLHMPQQREASDVRGVLLEPT